MARARLALRDLHKAGQDRHDDVAVPGKAYADEFTPDGRLVARVVNDGKKNAPLNAPWGLARAPSDFGIFGGDLLVGNFGNGRRSFFGGTWPTRPSKPDPVSPLERATSSADPHGHDCGHEAPHAAGVARSEERVRPRTQLACAGARRRANAWPRRLREIVTRPRSSSDTLPRLATDASRTRVLPSRRTRRLCSWTLRTIRPGTRTRTTTPSRIRTATRVAATGRAVNSTRTWWSPDATRRRRLTRRVKRVLEPGRRTRRVGTIVSETFAGGRGPSALRAVSTTTCLAPTFRSWIVREPGAANTRWAGETWSATGGWPAPTSFAEEVGAITRPMASASASRGLTGRPL
jgi:hypothetical protein